MILGKIFFLSIFIQKVKVTPLNQFRELQILWLFPARSSDTGTAGTGIEILGFCSAHPLDQHHPHTLIDIAIIIIINVYMGQGYIELFFFGISNKIKNRSKLRNNSPFEYNFIIKLPLPAYFINKRPFQDQFQVYFRLILCLILSLLGLFTAS